MTPGEKKYLGSKKRRGRISTPLFSKLIKAAASY